jgi:hypothetical protein
MPVETDSDALHGNRINIRLPQSWMAAMGRVPPTARSQTATGHEETMVPCRRTAGMSGESVTHLARQSKRRLLVSIIS